MIPPTALEPSEKVSKKCIARIWVDASRWRPRLKGTIKQWARGRPCRAWAMHGSDYCVVHRTYWS